LIGNHTGETFLFPGESLEHKFQKEGKERATWEGRYGHKMVSLPVSKIAQQVNGGRLEKRP